MSSYNITGAKFIFPSHEHCRNQIWSLRGRTYPYVSYKVTPPLCTVAKHYGYLEQITMESAQSQQILPIKLLGIEEICLTPALLHFKQNLILITYYFQSPSSKLWENKNSNIGHMIHRVIKNRILAENLIYHFPYNRTLFQRDPE